MNYYGGLVNPVISQNAYIGGDIQNAELAVWNYDDMVTGTLTYSSNCYIDSGYHLPAEWAKMKVALSKKSELDGSGYVSMQTELTALRPGRVGFYESAFDGSAVHSYVANDVPNYRSWNVRLREFVVGKPLSVGGQSRQFSTLKNSEFMGRVRRSLDTIFHGAVQQAQHYITNVITNSTAHIFAPLIAKVNGSSSVMMPYFTAITDKFKTVFNVPAQPYFFNRADGINSQATLGAKAVIGLMHQFLKRSANPDINLLPIFANPSFTQFGTGVNNYLPNTNEYLVDRYYRRKEKTDINTFEVIQTETLHADRSGLFAYGTKPGTYDSGYAIPQYDEDGNLISGNEDFRGVKIFKPTVPASLQNAYKDDYIGGLAFGIGSTPTNLSLNMCVAIHDAFGVVDSAIKMISTQNYTDTGAGATNFVFIALKETLDYFPEAKVVDGPQSFTPDGSWLIRAVDTSKLADRGVPSVGKCFIILFRIPKIHRTYIPMASSGQLPLVDGTEGKGEIRCTRPFKSNINPAQIYNNSRGEVVFDDSQQTTPTLYDTFLHSKTSDVIGLEMLELMLRGTTTIDNTKYIKLAPLANNRECVVSYRPDQLGIFPCPSEQVLGQLGYESILSGNTSALMEYQNNEVSNTALLYGTVQTYLHPLQTSHMVAVEVAISAGMPRNNTNCVLAAHAPTENPIIYYFDGTTLPTRATNGLDIDALPEVNQTFANKRRGASI